MDHPGQRPHIEALIREMRGPALAGAIKVISISCHCEMGQLRGVRSPIYVDPEFFENKAADELAIYVRQFAAASNMVNAL